MNSRNLNKMFYPKQVAVIGASNKLGSVGHQIVKNLKDYKNVFYINPRLAKSKQKIYNNKVYSSILDIDKQIDLAIIAIPAKFVEQVIIDLATTKCKNVILISAGFSEVGNNKTTQNIKKLLVKYNINLIGPNCLGILNLDNKLNATFNSSKLKLPNFGRCSIISQSGALGNAILDKANFDYLNINKFISFGNALDVDETDLIEYLANDNKTDVILCYLEGVKRGPSFFNTLKKYSSKKKIIILKGGTSKKGNLAAKSHTAAISGSNKVFKAAIEQAGAYLVDNMRDLFYLGKMFSNYKSSKIKNLQIITNGGGFGVLTSDQLDKQNIKLSTLSEKTKKQLKKIVPEYAILKNPLDLTGDADCKRFYNVIKICMTDKNIDCLAILILFQLPSINSEIITYLKKIKKDYKKPFFVLSIGGDDTENYLKKLELEDILCFKDPKDLAYVLKQMK